MSKYTFTFRKDDISVEFTTTDREVVANQFKIWVDDATEYTKTHPTEEKKTLEPVAKREQEEPSEQPKQQHQEPIQPSVSEQAPVQPVANVEVHQNNEASDNFDRAAELLKKVDTDEALAPVQQEVQSQAPAEPQTPQAEPQAEQVNSENENPPVTINTIQNPLPEVQPVPDFDKVLEQKIENPTFEPSSNKDTRFIDFLSAKNTRDKLHYLVITAFYFLQFDRVERFSLKQINSKLMHNIAELIDHTVIQEALNRQLIELIPDLTGMSEVSEYRLTEKGEDFFINGLRAE